jgi:hypothetical protein
MKGHQVGTGSKIEWGKTIEDIDRLVSKFSCTPVWELTRLYILAPILRSRNHHCLFERSPHFKEQPRCIAQICRGVSSVGIDDHRRFRNVITRNQFTLHLDRFRIWCPIRMHVPSGHDNERRQTFSPASRSHANTEGSHGGKPRLTLRQPDSRDDDGGVGLGLPVCGARSGEGRSIFSLLKRFVSTRFRALLDDKQVKSQLRPRGKEDIGRRPSISAPRADARSFRKVSLPGS